MDAGINDNQPTDADLKTRLMDLVKLQNLITNQLLLSTGHLAAVTRGINLIVSEIERRTTVNPDRPN